MFMDTSLLKIKFIKKEKNIKILNGGRYIPDFQSQELVMFT